MCGIVGIVSNRKNTEAIQVMTRCVSHRGPDASSTYVGDGGRIALGHTRLSIIDLKASANQPMHSDDGRYTIVFNGEIYNYKVLREALVKEAGVQFRTDSDTEVILKGFEVWRHKVVEKIDGMFALAIYDHREREIFLLRDRFGKKPLFYFDDGQLFVFGSEIKAVIAHPQVRSRISINQSVISTFLHLGYIPEPNTIYTGIKKFPAASFGWLDQKGSLTITPYWSIDAQTPDYSVNTTDEKVLGQFNTILHHAVSKRLVSDVPLGTFLSGGVDSSLVTAIASKMANSPLETFSIGFHEESHDESLYAEEVARLLGTQHTAYRLSEKEALELLEVYLDQFDEPFADTSAIPTMLVSKLAKKKVTVALTGDGGDELFLGYGAYLWAERLNSMPWYMARPAMYWLMRRMPTSRLMRVSHLLQRPKLGTDRSHIFSQEQYLFDQDEIKSNLLKSGDLFNEFKYMDDYRSERLSAAEKQSLFDVKYYLKDDLLVKVDRASMLFGLECRSPLLDTDLAAFAISLPLRFKIRNGVTKWILKEALKSYLPGHIVNRQKRGFSIPLSRWMKGELQYFFELYLSDKKVEETGLFDANTVRQLKTRYFAGDDYLYTRLWTLIVLQRWLLKNQIK